MRRASADHPRTLVSDLARRVRLPASITPVVRERYRARIEEFPRPSSRIERTVIRTRLYQQHRLLRMLRKKTRNRRSRSAATDHNNIGKQGGDPLTQWPIRPPLSALPLRCWLSVALGFRRHLS